MILVSIAVITPNVALLERVLILHTLLLSILNLLRNILSQPRDTPFLLVQHNKLTAHIWYKENSDDNGDTTFTYFF
jgi:hypothetical protein